MKNLNGTAVTRGLTQQALSALTSLPLTDLLRAQGLNAASDAVQEAVQELRHAESILAIRAERDGDAVALIAGG